jgi:hypothetical protein
MNRMRTHSIDVVFVLVLFCTFAMSVLMVLMIGASTYNDVTDDMSENYESRTGVAYIAEKIRHFGEEGAVAVGTHNGTQTLELSQDIDGEHYTTYVYCIDGEIREYFTKTGSDFPLSAGEAIVEAEDFYAEMVTDNLVKVTCVTGDGTENYIMLDVEAKNAAAQASLGGAA